MSGQRTIQFSVEFVTAASNFKKIINELQQELSKVKPGTQIYESIAQQIKQAQQLMRNTDFAIEKGITRGSDIDRVAQNFDLLTGRINNIRQSLSSLTFPDLNLGHSGLGDLGQQWGFAKTELAALLRQIDELQNKTVGGVLGDKTKGFEGVLDQNALQFYDELIQKAAAAKEQVAQLQAEQTRLEGVLANSTTITAKQTAASPYENALSAMGITGGNLPGAGRIADTMVNGSADAQSAINTMLQSLGLDKTTIQAVITEANGNVDKLTKSLQDLNVGTKLQNAIQGMTGTGSAKSLFSYVDQLRTAAQEAQNAITQLNGIQQQLNTAQANVSTLEGQKTTLGAVINPSQITDLQTQVSNLMARIANLESQIARRQSGGGGSGKQLPNIPSDDPAARAQLGVSEQQKQLGNAIDSYTKRWIGAYAIINKISSTIKQAWSDIQNLDKAMANIAVVTNMSVSDLWGQINEYMTIAQQYGVTTQGVYEVSQIYYQQGLSTSEVMAATTETLKLARIAGMDYAAAADAMTVAIRSFKMEMTDAATVTDVYSKVASSTASDSEELAIAMSKTASSAESVGSSFENTTAMLAVMIETTRESAQNLGSALKSIISRYGEMKIGATVDADGEALDYNKVDTALQSVGISIKDAQGQFRDFDDVIFELSEKWDSLDKNTQRYIATIMAGNRQQSRFIALVDNWERLDEVAGLANNAEDAGLLQYSKTLDSFDAKLNQLKNSFQSFYMQLFDSDAFKGFLDILNNILEGFSEMGTSGLAVLPILINGFRLAFAGIKGIIVSTFAQAFAQAQQSPHTLGQAMRSTIRTAMTKVHTTMVNTWRKAEQTNTQTTQVESNKRVSIERTSANNVSANKITSHTATDRLITTNTNRKYVLKRFPQTSTPPSGEKTRFRDSGTYAGISTGLSMGGMLLSAHGASLIGSGQRMAGSWAVTGGNMASYAGMGMSMLGPWGALIGAGAGLFASLSTLSKAYDKTTQLQDDLNAKTEAAEEAKIKKAEKTEEYTNLKAQLEKVKQLESKKDASQEDYNAWAQANNELVEKYPQLFGYMDQYGNKIADLTNSSDLLESSFLAMARAAQEANAAEIERLESEIKLTEGTEYKAASLGDYAANIGVAGTAGAAIGAGAGALAAAKIGAAAGTAAGPVGTAVGALIGGVVGLIGGAIYAKVETDKQASKARAADQKFVRENISQSGDEDFSNKELADYIRKNNIDLDTLLEKGAKGTLEGDEASLYTLMKNYGIINENNKLVESFSEYWTGYTELLSRQKDALSEQNVALQIQARSMQSASDDGISEINGYTRLIMNMGLAKGLSMEDLTNLSLETYETLISPFNQIYNSLSGVKKEEFENLYDNLLNFSIEELIDKLESFGFKKGDGIYEAYIKEWNSQALESRQRLINTVFAENFDTYLDPTEYGEKTTYREGSMELVSYSEWWERNKGKEGYANLTDQQKYEKYKEFLDTKVKDLYRWNEEDYSSEDPYLDELYRLIFDADSGESKLSPEEEAALARFASSQDDVISSDASIFAKQAAEARRNRLALLYGEMGVIDWESSDWRNQLGEVGEKSGIDLASLGIDFSDWDKTDAQAFQQLLVADNAGSLEWQEQMNALAAKYGQTIDWTNEALDSFLYTNFNTRINTIADEVAGFIDELEGLGKKQSDGFSWEESQKLLKQFGEGYSWADLFEVNEQGLIVLKDFDKTVADLYNEKLDELNRLSGQVETALSDEFTWVDEQTGETGSTILASLRFRHEQYTGEDSDGGVEITAAESKEWLEVLQSRFNIGEELGQQLIEMIIGNVEMTETEYTEFLKELAQQNAELAKYFEKQKELIQANTAFDYYFSENFDAANTAKTAASESSLSTIKEAAIASGAITGQAVYKKDENGNVVVNDKGEAIVDYYDYDWATFFDNFEGISIDSYGEVLITDPAAYAESLIETLGETDQKVINDIYHSVFEQYHTQWQQRQSELETLFADYQFTDQEVAKMFAWAVANGQADADISMEEFAAQWGLEEIDGVWEVTSADTYYKMLTYAAAENPDLDFSDLPSWEEWAAQKAQDAITRKNEAVNFLKQLSIETDPKELEKAIDLGLLDVTKISEADLAAFEAGDKTVYDLIAAQRPADGFEDTELEIAWKMGQENYNQEISKWINDLFDKATLTPEELLEIWELLGAPEGDFKAWAEKGFEYDAKAGNYRLTADSYEVYAQAAAAKGATEMPSRLDFLQTLHTGEKTQSDARTQALSSLSVDATIHDLDAVYQAGLITDDQYLQAITDAAAGRKTYYESIVGFVDRSNKEIDDAVQEIEAKQITAMQADIDSLFGDTTLDDDSIKKMWLDAETDKDMFSWAEEALGVVYENGEWVIKNASQAWATMSEWFKEEYGEDNYAKYMTPEKQQEFQSMWANYQDVQSESIISFIEGLSPESGEDILSEAVELGLVTWEEIATYKSQGYNAYDTIRAIAKKEGSTWTKEQKAALEEGWKTYQRETANAVTDLFEDGLFSEEDMENMWIASGSDLSFDDWMARTLQVDGTQVSFFEKVGDGWVIKSRQAYDEMVQWVADTYGAEFVALLPSYDKLQAMGGLEEARQKENKLDYLTGLTPEMGVEDLEKAVELGIITEDEMAYIIAADVNYWDAISAAVNRMDAEYQQAFAESRAKYFDSLIGEADSYTKDTSWTTEQLTKRFGGSTDWMETGDFVLDLETGEWEAKNKEAYEALKDWVKSEYGEAYANLLPTWEDFEGQQIFEDGIKKTSDKVDIIKGLSYDFSLDDLEKLVEAGMLTYQEATAIWSSANPWETLLSTIKLSSQEELDAFNQMVTENNIAMGEAALALFNDSSLTWDEVSTLWANQLGEGGETDIVKWAQSMGLEFIDGEWKITTEEAYNNMVAAAKELYGEAWAAMVPSKDDILAANLLDEQVTRDSKVDFIEGLNFEEITASDMQKAIEQGVITSEQLMWARENGIDYQTLIGMAISHDQEMVQAFNEGLVEYNLTQRENMMTLFDDNVLSQEQVIQMWHDMGSGQTFDSWLAGSGIEFIDGEFRIDSAAAFNTVKEWAKTYWGDAWNSIPWSTITAEQWEAGMANIEAMETDAAIESFFSNFDADAGMDEAYKAVELGILTQEQLLHGLAQGFSVWDVVTSYALESTENYGDFIDMINNRTRAEYLSSAFSLGTADSWSSDQIISLWDLNGRTENSNFIDWAQDNGFIINESGQWEASTKEAYQSMLDYIEVTFGAAYANALPTADEWEAANLLEKAKTDSNRTNFIKGLTADADIAEILQQAIDYGILDLNDYINEEGKLELPSRDELFADIGANLHSQEDVDAFNEAMFLIEQDRIKTISSLMEDNSFSGSELYEIWKKTAQTGVSFSDWLSDAGFILQKDGSYKAMGEAAYNVMVSYVRDNFGEAFVALLPTKEDWENSKLLEDFHSEMDMGEFLSGLNVNATMSDLDEAAELFGITYTEDQLNAIKEGSKTVYEVILESLAPEGWVDGVFGRTGPMADVVNEIERMNRDALIAELPFGELLTTAEDFTSAAQTLAALGFDEDSYKEMLADGRIGLEDTIAILEESQYYLDAATVNDEGEVENAGEALFAAAQAYGLSLDDFFEMEVYSPALILERLGLQLDQLTAKQYDSFRTAQANYAESVSKLFSGTGSATDMEKLLATINYGRDADAQWDYSVFYETAEGIQLDRSKFFEALSILKEQDWELYSSIRETLVSSPELLGEEFDSIMEVQQAINELGLEHINLLEEQNAALREQASIYGEIYAQMSMNKSEGWDFLNAELHGNAQNFMSWGDSVRSTFEQLGNKDGIEPMAFINMLNYMQQMGTTVETLGGNFASWGELMTSAYSAFGKAIVTGTNVTVDDLGISTENMTNAMFESMQKTARQQVDFLDGQIAMLEGIKAISDIDEGELSIGSIYQTMADEVSKYNAETGSDIKLDNIFITVGGERFPFTEEGLAKAQEKYNTLFENSGISFEQALQTSLGNNFGVVMEGGTIGITPTGVMEVELSVDGAAITDSLSETNGYLTNINSSLITIVGLLSTGKNPWTAEGAAAYFTDEEGNSVIPQTPEELREWYANLDPISQAIYRNYEKTTGIPFEYSPIASVDGYQEGEYGKNIYTITTANGEKITGQQVVIETIDGKATPTYATGLDESGKGINYRALPETAEQQFSQLADIYTNKGFILSSQAMGGLALTEDYSLVNGEWRNSSGELATGHELDRLNALINELETLASVGELTPWEQALYYTAIGQPEKVPGYGVNGKGYTTPNSSTPVNVNTLLEKTNSELGSVVANTAEANSILAAMASKMDLSNETDAKNYLKTYRGFNEQWQTDSEGFKTWWQGASETDRKLWRQFYSSPETATQTEDNWKISNEAVTLAVDWEESGLPDDDEAIKEVVEAAWTVASEGETIPEDIAWMEQYYTPPEQEGGTGAWDWEGLWQDTHFIPWLASGDYGRQYYTENTSTPEPQTRVLTEGEKTTRENWFNSLTPAEQGNFLTSLGYTGIEYTHDANGITGISSYGTAAQTGTPGAANLDAILANSGFEKQYAIAIGGIFDKFYEGINQYRDLAAKAIELDGYEQRDGNWYKKGSATAVDSDTAARLTENQAALANGALDDLKAQLQAWANMLGIQFDPNMLYEAGANSLTNDAILRTTSKVDEAMTQLQNTMSDVSTYISTLTTANLIPEMPQFSPDNIEELVNLGIISQADVNTWLDALNEAYRTGDTAGANEANSTFEGTIRAGHQEYENELTTQINDLTTQLSTANESVATLTADKAALEADKEELEGRLETAEANLAGAQAELDAANATLEERKARVNELNQNYQDLLSQQTSLNQQLADARAAGDQAAVLRLTAEMTALQTQITATEMAMAAAESEVKNAEAQVATWQQAVETAQAEKTTILNSLSAVSATLAETNANLAETYSTIAELEQLLSEKEAALAAANRALAEYEANKGNQEAADDLNQTATELEESSTQHADNSSEARDAALQAEILADPLRAYGSNYVEGGSLSPFLEQTGLTVLDMVQAYDRKNGDLSYLNAGDFPLMHAYGSYVDGWGNLSALHGRGVNVNALDPRIIDGLLNFGSYENGWLHTNNSLWAEDEEAYQTAFTAAKDSNDPLAMVRFIADYYGMDIPDFAKVVPEVTQPEVTQPSVEPSVEPEVTQPEVTQPYDHFEETHYGEDFQPIFDKYADFYYDIPGYNAEYGDPQIYKLFTDRLETLITNTENSNFNKEDFDALMNFGQLFDQLKGYEEIIRPGYSPQGEEVKGLYNLLNDMQIIPEGTFTPEQIEAIQGFNQHTNFDDQGNAQILSILQSLFGNFVNTLNAEDNLLQTDLSSAGEQINAAAGTINAAANRLAGTQIRVKVIGGTLAAATGNVSGLALADGNSSLDRLNVGARLAGKTLVGELGPELAVYDGMYHLLGQNGAEFVDLPSNAIVFNHRQTAGIVRGQIGYRGTALAEGNADDLVIGDAFAEGHITGPARASIDDTISQLKGLRAMWQNILDMDASQLAAAGGGGGGGGGNSLKATTADLEEWYNLLRQIEQIEQDITNLEAKRANIYDGSDYLKNLRETQKLLEKQRLTQQILLEYQQKQLEAQAKFINEHDIWSKFLTVGEDGLLQYIEGNEEVGGKGAIKVLQMLNEMSGKDQEKFVKSLGYSATDEEGKALKGEKLVARFYEELQDQIDQYDELYETVHSTEAELEDLASNIEDINNEIIENQKELETDLYDIIVEAWEKEIEQLEEQKELIEEMNDAYTKGLKDALSAEKDLYEDNQSTEERESLQRQLALLRRSGGSASEIADLEEQLNDSLKDEYFANQEKMIENIEDANERQVKKLEEQIKLQQEALEYEKENGVIWSKVYEVLKGSQEEILAFMQGNSTDFFSKSALEQEEMLLDWAKKIGIYSEDQQHKIAMAEAEKHWNSDAMWNGEVLKGLQGNYDKLTDEQKASLGEYFKSSYSSARLDGVTEEDARHIAEANVKAILDKDSNAVDWSDLEGSNDSGGEHYKVAYTVYFVDGQTQTGEGWGNTASVAQAVAERKAAEKTKSPKVETTLTKDRVDSAGNVIARKGTKVLVYGGGAPVRNIEYKKAVKYKYKQGGLVDYTGLAQVDGTPSRPEAFLNAAQTAQIKEALQATNGKKNLLEGLHSTIAELRSLIHNISTINNSTNNNITVAPGAVVIQVEQLADSYDVEALSADVMNRMVAIASKATNRGVNRR